MQSSMVIATSSVHETTAITTDIMINTLVFLIVQASLTLSEAKVAIQRIQVLYLTIIMGSR